MTVAHPAANGQGNDARWAAVILAAGRGKRLGGDRPKVLHDVGGRPMVLWVIDAARAAGAKRTVLVVGHRREDVIAALPDGVEWVVQEEPRGTGDAARAAEGAFAGYEGNLWVLSGDVPGVRPRTLRKLAAEHEGAGASCTVLTMELDKSERYGRVVRDDGGRVARIVEFADADEEERAVRELNSGTYAFRARDLFETLPRLSDRNAQGEFYLTDAVRLLIDDGLVVAAVKADDPRECMGGDTPEALEAVRAGWGRD